MNAVIGPRIWPQRNRAKKPLRLPKAAERQAAHEQAARIGGLVNQFVSF